MAQNNTPVKALVLAGGGARGSYQVGVWRALTELGWRPQIITGTSVGSLSGAMFALGLLGALATARVLKAAWSRAMKMTAVLKDRHHSIVVITMCVALDRD